MARSELADHVWAAPPAVGLIVRPHPGVIGPRDTSARVSRAKFRAPRILVLLGAAPPPVRYDMLCLAKAAEPSRGDSLSTGEGKPVGIRTRGAAWRAVTRP